MLRPADPTKGNGALLYEVNNRGSIAMLSQFDETHGRNNDPTRKADAGNASCSMPASPCSGRPGPRMSMRPPEEKRLVLHPPVATDHGKPLTGKVAYEIIVDAPAETARFTGIDGMPYAFAQAGAPDAVLSMRDSPEGKRRGREAGGLVLRGAAGWQYAEIAPVSLAASSPV